MNYTKLFKSEHSEVTQMRDTFHLQNPMSETCVSDVSRHVEMRATAGNWMGAPPCSHWEERVLPPDKNGGSFMKTRNSHAVV